MTRVKLCKTTTVLVNFFAAAANPALCYNPERSIRLLARGDDFAV